VRKSTKGALAASAAALLLLGGLGTHATWSDDDSVPGTALGAGHLALVNVHCDGWLISGDPFDPASIKIVPGDVLTQVCRFEVDALGANLSAELDVTSPSFQTTNGLTGELSTSAVYKNGTTTINAFPATVNDGDIIEATISVSLPDTATNAVQDLSATLKSVTVTATQA
jgi:alternate signal-mediated exported protein